MFRHLQEQINSEKPELKAVVGMMKGLMHSLERHCTLEAEQVERLFTMLRTAITPLEGVQTHGVIKAGMKLLTSGIRVFQQHVTRQSVSFVGLNLCNYCSYIQNWLCTRTWK